MVDHLRFHVELAPLTVEFVTDNKEKEEVIQRWCKRGMSVKLELGNGYKFGLFVTNKSWIKQGDITTVTIDSTISKPLKFFYVAENEQELKSSFLKMEISKTSRFSRRSQSLSKSSSFSESNADDFKQNLDNVCVFDMICGPETSWVSCILGKGIKCRLLILHKFLQECPHMNGTVYIPNGTKDTIVSIVSVKDGTQVAQCKMDERKNGTFSFEFATNAIDIFYLTIVTEHPHLNFPFFGNEKVTAQFSPKYWQLSVISDKTLLHIHNSPWPSLKMMKNVKDKTFCLGGLVPFHIINRLDISHRSIQQIHHIVKEFNQIPDYISKINFDTFLLLLSQWKTKKIASVFNQKKLEIVKIFESKGKTWMERERYNVEMEYVQLESTNVQIERELEKIEKVSQQAIEFFKLVRPV
jgi:hypothetical protein